MGLANNHAFDFGAAALKDCAARLSQQQVLPIGVGKPESNDYTPRFFSVLHARSVWPGTYSIAT